MKPSKHARPMTVTEMASLGGFACAKVRSPAERTRVARKAVNERWRRYRERRDKAIHPEETE